MGGGKLPKELKRGAWIISLLAQMVADVSIQLSIDLLFKLS